MCAQVAEFMSRVYTAECFEPQRWFLINNVQMERISDESAISIYEQFLFFTRVRSRNGVYVFSLFFERHHIIPLAKIKAKEVLAACSGIIITEMIKIKN